MTSLATAISIDAQPRGRLLCKTVNMTSFIISRGETSRVSQVPSATATSVTRTQFGSDRTCVQYAGYRQFQLGMFTHREANSPATITSSLNRFAVASSVLCPTVRSRGPFKFCYKNQTGHAYMQGSSTITVPPYDTIRYEMLGLY